MRPTGSPGYEALSESDKLQARLSADLPPNVITLYELTVLPPCAFPRGHSSTPALAVWREAVTGLVIA